MYKATTPKHLIVFLLGLDLILVPVRWGETLFWMFTILIALTCMLMYFLKYEFDINEQTLLYRIQLFTFTIYEKQVNAQDVRMIHFKRISWYTRIAIVKLNKGWNLRISLFRPDTVLEELERYAERNNISISKTKDYKILEKMA
ncbi:diguanylate cyclase [Lysinibacillus sp. NPDC096418]|uniref:diguanylate cyclase n=1 Tax=Lysinibacillus sp. NPDC096418 TaxID=3364138 RepID=UPI00380F38B2